MYRTVSALALIAGIALTTIAAAARIDVPVVIGEAASGEITETGDVSACGFLVNAGESRKLSITVKRSKGSALEPEVKLIDPDGDELDVGAAGGKVKAKSSGTKIQLNAVPTSGLWRLEVRGAGGTTGAYGVTVKAQEKVSLKDTVVIPLGGNFDVPVDVGDAQTITVAAKRAKRSEVVPGIDVIGPDGSLVEHAIGAAAVNTKKGSAKLSKLELPSFGRYTIRLKGSQATGGSAVYSIKTSPTKLKGGRPTADPGAAFAVEPASEAALDGTGSRPDGSGPLKYVWTQVAGPTVALSSRSAASPTFTAPATNDTLAFQLAVSQSGVFSAPRIVSVDVADRPIADPGRARVVTPGSTVTLDGTASIDRAGSGLSATWRIVEGPGTLTDTDTFAPEFTAPNTEGVTRIGLVVNDGTAESFESEVVVVTSATPATVADAGREQYVGRMATVFLSGLASQRAGAILDGGASWEQLAGPPVELSGADTYFPSFTAPREPGDLLFELTVGGETETSHRTWVRVRNGIANRPPVSNAGNHTFASGGSVVLNASASSDFEGVEPVERWAIVQGAGGTIVDPSAEQTTATGLDDAAGVWLFAAQVRDDLQYGAPDLKRVIGPSYAAAPITTAGADRTVLASASIVLEGAANASPGGGTLSYSWRQVSGQDWFDIASELPTFNPAVPRPTLKLREGLSSLTQTRSITLEFTATDANGTSARDYVTITFTNIPLNGLPTVQASASQSNPLPGTSVTLSAVGTDPEGEPVTYRWSQTAGQLVTLSPSATAQNPSFQAPSSGTLTFQVFADDGLAEGPPATVSVTVDRRPVAIATIDPETGGAGTDVTFDGSQSFDPENAGLTYTWTQLTGTPVSFPANDESFTVTSPEGGFSFRLVVNDGRQDSAAVTVAFADNAPPDVAPTATIGGNTATQAAYGATVTLRANPSDSNPATFTWRQIGIGSSSPAVTLSSTSSETPSFAVPKPTSSGRFGANPKLTFGVKATRGGIESTEQTVEISIYASFDDSSLSSGDRVWTKISSNCQSCHFGSNNSCPVGGGSNASGYGMGSKSAFISNSVGASSCGSSLKRIETSGSDKSGSSRLIQRINGTSGGSMPPGGLIPLADRYLIMDWVDQGSDDTR